MSSKEFKCGNCGKIEKTKFFSARNYNQRLICEICGPLCKECYGRGLFDMDECKGCGKKGKIQNYLSHKGWT
jgi:hypothetical protein